MKTLIKTWNGEFGTQKKVNNHQYLVSKCDLCNNIMQLYNYCNAICSYNFINIKIYNFTINMIKVKGKYLSIYLSIHHPDIHPSIHAKKTTKLPDYQFINMHASIVT